MFPLIGTHGARTNYGNLATLVTKLRLVTGEGNILTLTANDNDTEIFNAAVVIIAAVSFMPLGVEYVCYL